MAQSMTLSLAYLAGRASGVPLEAGTVSRYLRIPQILAAHCLTSGALRLRGRRFETDVPHRLAFEVGRHRSSGPGWFAGGNFDRSVCGYPTSERMETEFERSSDIYEVRLFLSGRMISSVSHDGEKIASWVDPAVPQDLHREIDRIFLRYVNPWFLSRPEDYAAFGARCQKVEVDLAKALSE